MGISNRKRPDSSPGQTDDATSGMTLKGVLLPITLIRLNGSDSAEILSVLDQKLGQHASFFSGAAMAIDASGITNIEDTAFFHSLVKKLRDYGLLPAGICHATVTQLKAAADAGLGRIDASVLKEIGFTKSEKGAEQPMVIRRRPELTPPSQKQANPGVKTPSLDTALPTHPLPLVETSVGKKPAQGKSHHAVHAPIGPRVVEHGIRSGQQIYGRGTDLVVVGPVNPGGEVLADGSIHIYGALRGRAAAGLSGDESARIYCRAMEAELVSIAGAYQVVDESLPSALRGKPVQIYLEDGRLVMTAVP